MSRVWYLARWGFALNLCRFPNLDVMWSHPRFTPGFRLALRPGWVIEWGRKVRMGRETANPWLYYQR